MGIAGVQLIFGQLAYALSKQYKSISHFFDFPQIQTGVSPRPQGEAGGGGIKVLDIADVARLRQAEPRPEEGSLRCGVRGLRAACTALHSTGPL